MRLPTPGDNPGRYPVNGSTGQTPADLATDLLIKPGIKAGVAPPRDRRKGPADDKIADADNQRHGHSRSDNPKTNGPKSNGRSNNHHRAISHPGPMRNHADWLLNGVFFEKP